MAPPFDILAKSPAGVDEILTAFGRRDHWRDRLSGGVTTVESLHVDGDGSVSVAVTGHLGRQLMPRVVAKAVPAGSIPSVLEFTAGRIGENL